MIDSIDDGFSNFTCDNDLQSRNTLFPAVLIDEGIVMCKNDLHPANDHSSIELTEEGIIISFNDEQFLKTEFQIFATD